MFGIVITHPKLKHLGVGSGRARQQAILRVFKTISSSDMKFEWFCWQFYMFTVFRIVRGKKYYKEIAKMIGSEIFTINEDIPYK